MARSADTSRIVTPPGERVMHGGIEVEIRDNPNHSRPATHIGHFFHYVGRGMPELHLASGKVRLPAGSVVLTPGGLPYRLHSPSGSNHQVQTVRVRASAFHLSSLADRDAWAMLMALKRYVLENGPVLAIERLTRDRLADRFGAMAAVGGEVGPVHRMRLKAQVLALLADLAEDGRLGRRLGRVVAITDGMRQVLWYMDQHFYRDCPVRELAAMANLKPSQFHHLFRSQVGTTPVRYLMRLRIGQACRLLIETERPIAQIGLVCGYAGPAQFYEAFKQITGTTPARFRRQMRPAAE